MLVTESCIIQINDPRTETAGMREPVRAGRRGGVRFPPCASRSELTERRSGAHEGLHKGALTLPICRYADTSTFVAEICRMLRISRHTLQRYVKNKRNCPGSGPGENCREW